MGLGAVPINYSNGTKIDTVYGVYLDQKRYKYFQEIKRVHSDSLIEDSRHRERIIQTDKKLTKRTESPQRQTRRHTYPTRFAMSAWRYLRADCWPNAFRYALLNMPSACRWVLGDKRPTESHDPPSRSAVTWRRQVRPPSSGRPRIRTVPYRTVPYRTVPVHQAPSVVQLILTHHIGSEITDSVLI